jgi:hypothetical protein
MAIGKVGKWTDKNNQSVSIDEKYLDEVVSNTNPEDVKFVIEHPKYNKIGFGKTSALKRVGELLFALPKEVNEDFKNAVNAGELPGRSMTINKATKKLLDISFLPPEIDPAIDGLGAYSFQSSIASSSEDVEVFYLQSGLQDNESHFAEVDNDLIQFAQAEMSGYGWSRIKDLAANLREFILVKFGKEEADQVVSRNMINDLDTPPRIFIKDEPKITNSFSKNKNEEEMDLSKIDLYKVDPNIKAALESLNAENQKLKTDYDAKNVELQAATATITKAESEKIEAEVLQFCSSEKIARKILPAKKDRAVRFLTAQKEKGVLEFSLADGKKENFDAFEFAKELIENLPDAIDTNEFASSKTAAEQTNLSDAQKVGKEIAAYANR